MNPTPALPELPEPAKTDCPLLFTPAGAINGAVRNWFTTDQLLAYGDAREAYARAALAAQGERFTGADVYWLRESAYTLAVSGSQTHPDKLHSIADRLLAPHPPAGEVRGEWVVDDAMVERFCAAFYDRFHAGHMDPSTARKLLERALSTPEASR